MSPKIIQDLQVNIKESKAPLIAGFYLIGPTINHKKRWVFGKNQHSEINNNLICNHTYRKPGKYYMHVEILDERQQIIEKSKTIHITVKPKTKKLNFDQWGGVIYKGDSVGFSISTTIRDKPTIKWMWGDGTSNSSEDRKFYPRRLNPHHKFLAAKRCIGKVSIKKKPEQEEQKFGILVLPSAAKKLAGFIQITSAAHTEKGFPSKTPLTFQVQLSGTPPKFQCIWNFGDKTGTSGMMVKHTYKKANNYRVTCTIRDKTSTLKLVLVSTIVII